MIQPFRFSLYLGLNVLLSGDFTMKIKIKLYTILEKYTKGKVLEDDTIILPKEITLKGLSHYIR
jgi:hypothetical protein